MVQFQAYVPYAQETGEFLWPIIPSENIATRRDWMGQGHQAAESGSLMGLALGKVIYSQSWGGTHSVIRLRVEECAVPPTGNRSQLPGW